MFHNKDPSKIFFILSRREATEYEKYKVILKNEGWTKIHWLQNFSSLEEKLQHLDQMKQDDDMIIACLAIIELPRIHNKQNEQQLLQLIETNFHTKNRRLLLVANGINDEDDEIDKEISFLNKLLTNMRFNVQFRRDCAIGMSPLSMDPDKLYHPKEVKLTTTSDQFIVNRGLSQWICEQRQIEASPRQSLIRILYPYGCSLALRIINKIAREKQSSATVMMTTGQASNCLPKSQPICTFYKSKDANLANSFKMISFGSAKMFTDNYIEREDNFEIICAFMRFLSSQEDFVATSGQALSINMSDASTLEIEPNSQYTPHIDTILNYPLLPLPMRTFRPIDQLFDGKLFNIDNCMLAKLMQAYEDLSVDKGPLSLIKPHFECQSLPLEPAVHKFLLRRPT